MVEIQNGLAFGGDIRANEESMKKITMQYGFLVGGILQILLAIPYWFVATFDSSIFAAIMSAGFLVSGSLLLVAYSITRCQ
jgi:hypothetical protein